jgi:hypothetical protein
VVPRFEVFRIIDDMPVCAGVAETLEDAAARAKELCESSECIVFDHLNGDTVSITVDELRP